MAETWTIPKEPTAEMAAAAYQAYVQCDRKGYVCWADVKEIIRAYVAAAPDSTLQRWD